jgi:hypothetical protein
VRTGAHRPGAPRPPGAGAGGERRQGQRHRRPAMASPDGRRRGRGRGAPGAARTAGRRGGARLRRLLAQRAQHDGNGPRRGAGPAGAGLGLRPAAPALGRRADRVRRRHRPLRRLDGALQRQQPAALRTPAEVFRDPRRPSNAVRTSPSANSARSWRPDGRRDEVLRPCHFLALRPGAAVGPAGGNGSVEGLPIRLRIPQQDQRSKAQVSSTHSMACSRRRRP